MPKVESVVVEKPKEKPKGPSLDDRVTELEGDLVRIVQLLITGDLDSLKFRDILAKHQGRAKLSA